MRKDDQFFIKLQSWAQDYDKENAGLFLSPEFFDLNENYKMYSDRVKGVSYYNFL